MFFYIPDLVLIILSHVTLQMHLFLFFYSFKLLFIIVILAADILKKLHLIIDSERLYIIRLQVLAILLRTFIFIFRVMLDNNVFIVVLLYFINYLCSVDQGQFPQSVIRCQFPYSPLLFVNSLPVSFKI